MQNINVTVYRSIFKAIFILLVPISVITAIWSIIAFGWANSLFVVIGALFYVFGMFMVTGRGNVPLNESLKQIDINHQGVDVAWSDYYKRWTRLNTLRCIFGTAAGLSWMLAAYRLT